MYFEQAEFDIRCEWGEHGVRALAPSSDAVIIVDVMSFSTSVTIATARGARVFPYRWNDGSETEFASTHGAVVAGRRGEPGYSLSPTSLTTIVDGTRLVLPSPNGSTLTLLTGDTPTFAGCLRNARSVAAAASRFGQRIVVIPCGERWPADGSLRPCFEDLVGAGAIISFLSGQLSPESRMALASFESAQNHLPELCRQCTSGRELLERGFDNDVELSAQSNADSCAPILRDGAYVKLE